MFIDADMILTSQLIEACVTKMRNSSSVALHIEEVVLGRGLLAEVRRFERSFYSGTVIDGVRFFRRTDFESLGGFDANLPPGPEDWDLDKRFKLIGPISLLSSVGAAVSSPLGDYISRRGVEFDETFVGVYHNESEQSVRQYLRKKAYYSGSMATYVDKWGKHDPDLRQQLGLLYRYFLVFVEAGRWRKLVRHPFLSISMILLRVAVGVTFILRKKSKAPQLV
jgi:hypothetical protein